jgi:prepilin-type processing-associated H-X9-DG protein
LPHPTLPPADYTIWGFYTYKYNSLLGGNDTTHLDVATATATLPSEGQPVWNTTSGWVNPSTGALTAPPMWWAQPLKRILNSSQVIMFGDYPQVQVFSTQDNRGFKEGAGNLRAMWEPFIYTDPLNNQRVQCIGDTAPVHNSKPATGVPFPYITDTASGQSWRSLTGQINVCYCDGSVTAITVTQGLFVNTQKVSVNNDPTSGGNGYTLLGTAGYWPGSRLDPNGPMLN